MELYAQVRRSVYVEGLSEREATRRFGLARDTVRKMLRYAAPPGYRRSKPVRRPKLDPFAGIIAQILSDDPKQPRKQRHTAKRMLPSPVRRGLGLRGYCFSRPPMGSLTLRPGDLLTIPRMALSVGFICFVSSTDTTQATGS